MPYTMSTLPKNIKKLSPKLQKQWLETFNAVFKKEGEKVAFIVANSLVLKSLKKEPKPIKRSLSILEFDIEPGQLLKRSDDGEDYISLVLASDKPHKDGQKYNADVLKGWADDINSGKILLADLDHDYYDELVKSNLTTEQIKQKLLNKPKSIAKSIKAIFEKGKLYLRAFIDKRYRRIIENSKGVSLEALVDYADDGKTIIGGDILGFTFNVKSTPADTAGVIA